MVEFIKKLLTLQKSLTLDINIHFLCLCQNKLLHLNPPLFGMHHQNLLTELNTILALE